MAKFYVETSRPVGQKKLGLAFKVFRESEFSIDVLSPCMTAVFEVDYVNTKNEAVAAVIERAADFGTAVRLRFGGKNASKRPSPGI